MISKRFVVAAALVFGGVAHADDRSDAERKREDAEIGHVDETPEDPSAHFNMFGVHYRGKDEYGGEFGDGKMVDENTGKTEPGEEPMSPPFVFMLINFALLLFVLGKYGSPAARKLAQERHDQIKTSLDDAAKLRDAAKAKLAEYESRIAGLDAEIKLIVDDIRASAEADKARILAAAKAQAEALKKDSELRIAAEILTARAELTREVTVAAAVATEKLLRDKVTADDQSKLVGTFIAGVAPTSAKEAR